MKFEIRREENWIRDAAKAQPVYAAMTIRPANCPLGLEGYKTDCTRCDHYDGLTFVNQVNGKYMVTVNCAERLKALATSVLIHHVTVGSTFAACEVSFKRQGGLIEHRVFKVNSRSWNRLGKVLSQVFNSFESAGLEPKNIWATGTDEVRRLRTFGELCRELTEKHGLIVLNESAKSWLGGGMAWLE